MQSPQWKPIRMSRAVAMETGMEKCTGKLTWRVSRFPWMWCSSETLWPLTLRAGLLLPGRSGSVPAAGHEVRLLSHRHTAQLPPGDQTPEGHPGTVRRSDALSVSINTWNDWIGLDRLCCPISLFMWCVRSSTHSLLWLSLTARTWCWSCSLRPWPTAAAPSWAFPSDAATSASTCCLRSQHNSQQLSKIHFNHTLTD